MDSVLAASEVDRGLKSRSSQTKDFSIGIFLILLLAHIISL
jgi:hypothetical protein